MAKNAARARSTEVPMRRYQAWPGWAEVKGVWDEVTPPPVEIIRFVPGTHDSRWPWFDRVRREQVPEASPTEQTAYYLSRAFPNLPADCLAAFKLFACCWEGGEHAFAHYVVEPVLRCHGRPGYDWWNGNAKWVMPMHQSVLRKRRDESAQADEWRDLVSEAVEHWKQLAERWAIVRIPRLMDPTSADYLAYLKVDSAKYEKWQREEYERLKKRYDTDT